MPTPAPQILGQNVMINLIGTDYNPEWRNLPCARVYWYGKEVRPGRKVGHINIVSANPTELRETLILLGDILPDAHYAEAINWGLDAISG
jgi:5-(carboxyamino)imidazole ribonucleotide synthase